MTTPNYLPPVATIHCTSMHSEWCPAEGVDDCKLIALIGESLAAVKPGFDVQRFQARAMRDLNKLELKVRALSIAHAMAEQIPASFDDLTPLLMSCFNRDLVCTI